MPLQDKVNRRPSRPSKSSHVEDALKSRRTRPSHFSAVVHAAQLVRRVHSYGVPEHANCSVGTDMRVDGGHPVRAKVTGRANDNRHLTRV